MNTGGSMRIGLNAAALVLALFSTLGAAEAPPPGGPPRDFTLPPKETLALDNGMRVTLVPFGPAPKVTLAAVVRSGHLNEDGRTWIADLAAELMKEGTARRSAEALARELAGMGGSLDISVGDDLTTVSTDVLGEFSPSAIDVLADVLRNPALPEAELPRIRRDALRNLSVARAQAQSQALEAFRSMLYGDHPYGRVFPTEEQLAGYGIGDVRSYLEANVGARRTHLYVVGRFDARAVRAAVKQAFGGWAPGPEPMVKVPGARAGSRFTLIDRPDAPQSTLYLGLPVADPASEDYVPLLATNTLLGGYFSSRIVANIREDKGYTYSPRAEISTRYRDAYWVERADVTTAVTGPALKEIFHELERLQAEAPPAEELERTKRYMAGVFVLQNASREGIIGQLSFIDLHGLGDRYLEEFVSRVEAVTPEQVRDMTRRYLKVDAMSLAVVGDTAVVREQLVALPQVGAKAAETGPDGAGARAAAAK